MLGGDASQRSPLVHRSFTQNESRAERTRANAQRPVRGQRFGDVFRDNPATRET